MLDPLLPEVEGIVDTRDVRRRTLMDLLTVLLVVTPIILLLGDGRKQTYDDPRHIAPEAPGMYTPDDEISDNQPAGARANTDEKLHAGADYRKWVMPGCEGVAELVLEHGLPLWMTAVAWRESRCQPAAVNRDHRSGDESYGIFQINMLGYLREEAQSRCGVSYGEELLDADRNVACAAALYRAYGYRPWNSGVYFRD
jgi:hypothetical protein